MAKRKKGSVGAIDDNTRDLIKYGAVLAIGYFGLVRPITNMLHLTKNADSKKQAATLEANKKANGWDPMYWDTLFKNKVLHTMSTSYSSIYAVAIYSALNWWGDDEEKVYGTLKQLRSQAELSYLSHIFYDKYKQSLYDYIKASFNDNEMERVAEITSVLPNYIPLKK